MTDALPESVLRFIAEARWLFAQTMPEWPHWYVLKRWHPQREAEFMELVRLIFETGRDQVWQPGTPRERTTRYLNVGEFKYWVMDPTIDTSDLINRARLDGAGPSS